MAKYGHGKYGVGPYKCYDLITRLIDTASKNISLSQHAQISRPLNMGRGEEKDIPNMIRNVDQIWNLFNKYDGCISKPLNMGKGTIEDVPNLIKNISQLWNRYNKIVGGIKYHYKIRQTWE